MVEVDNDERNGADAEGKTRLLPTTAAAIPLPRDLVTNVENADFVEAGPVETQTKKRRATAGVEMRFVNMIFVLLHL